MFLGCRLRYTGERAGLALFYTTALFGQGIRYVGLDAKQDFPAIKATMYAFFILLASSTVFQTRLKTHRIAHLVSMSQSQSPSRVQSDV